MSVEAAASATPAAGSGAVRVAHLTTTHDAFDARIFLKECRTLAAAGYDVTLVVPHGRDEVRDGVRVRGVPLPASRSERATRTAWQVYRAALACGARVCHLHDPELLPYGLLLKLAGRRVLYDVHENLPRDILSKHYLPAPLRAVLSAVAAVLERAACAAFDGVVAATPGIAQRFPGPRTWQVRNFPLLSEFPAPGATPHAERAPVFVYLGGLNWIRGLREMVRAVGLMPAAAGAQLRLAGRFDPPGLERELASEPGWSRTACLPWQDRAGVAETLGSARAGLLVLHAVPNHVDSLPVKLFEYMAAGLPVVASDFPAWREVLGDAGWYVDPLDPGRMAAALAEILASPQEAQRRGALGRAAIERGYHWEREAAVLLECYRRVAGPPRPARGASGMRVAFVTQFFPPETGAGANRAGAIAAALAQRFTLRVVTLAPGYPDPALYAGIDWAAADRGRGFDVSRRPAFRPHDTSLVRRALREAGMSLSLVASAGGPRPEVVLVSTPSMFLAPVAWVRARTSGARFAWDVRDLTWRYAVESAPATGVQRWLARGLERAMLALLKRADLVIAATEGLANVLQRQGVPAGRTITLANGVPRAFLERFADSVPEGSRARPRVSYVGLMGYNHGIGILLDVARLLPQVDVVLVGDGPERAAIEARLRAGGPANVRLCPYVTDPEALAAHYLDTDVLVNHTRSTPVLNDIVFSAKIPEYFATGRPVVYAGSGHAAEKLHAEDLALVVPPDDPGALARGIEAVLADPQAARQRAARARRWVEAGYCREQQMEKLVAEIERRLGAACPP